MEFTAKSVKKTLSVSSGKLLGGKVRNLITGAEYSLDIKDEFTVCYRKGASLLSARKYITSADCDFTQTERGYIAVKGGFSARADFSAAGDALRQTFTFKFDKDVFIDYIQFSCGEQSARYSWCAPVGKRVFQPAKIAAVGQPVYNGDIFTAIESPMGENTIASGRVRMRYYTGRMFSQAEQGGAYTPPSVVYGGGERAEFKSMRRDFFRYVRTFSRPEKFRIQFNSWYDNMLDIDPSKIKSSFTAVQQGFSRAGLRPLDCYVVDDGWTEYDKPKFWEFNDKFKGGFAAEAELTRSLGSSFGVWFGPRGGYTTQTPKYAAHLTKIGYHKNVLSRDICTADSKYVADMCSRMAEFCQKYNVKYFKLDGFAIAPCYAKGHNHPPARGYSGKAFYTFLWECWCKGFEHIRGVCPDVCLNITSYAHCSPFFLKWADYVWMNNASDMNYIGKGDNLSQCLNYRDSRYRDLYEVRQVQFPAAHLYNHEPVYAARNYNPPLPNPSHKTVVYSDEQFALYLKCCMMRGSGLAEVYFSPSMMDGDKWNIAARTLEWAERHYGVLSHSEFFGGDPAKGEVYGYIAADGESYILMLRNSGDKAAKYSFDLPGAGRVSGELKPFEIKFEEKFREQ